MDLRRARAGEWIAGISGAALLVSLFLPWYEDGPRVICVTEPCPPAQVESTGWEALSGIDVALAVLAAVAIALPLVSATQRTNAVPMMHAALAALGGLAAGVLVLVRLAFVPDVGGSGDVAREGGLYLALAGATGTFVGGVAAMRDERHRGAGAGANELQPTPLAPPPDAGSAR